MFFDYLPLEESIPWKHLDKNSFSGGLVRKLTKIVAMIAIGSATVSYTHLDVYKRQIQGSSIPRTNFSPPFAPIFTKYYLSLLLMKNYFLYFFIDFILLQ